MIYLITGATHTGKTCLAQRLMEQRNIPYLSMDLLKMGLIRSGQTCLTPEDDRELVDYLWSITKEIIKTAIENRQNLIVEGCYIPFDWEKDLSSEYRKEVRYMALIMSEDYIRKNFDAICSHAHDIEYRRADEGLTAQRLMRENGDFMEGCRRAALPYCLIDGSYSVDPSIFD